MGKEVVYIGPYYGEFGCELTNWVPYARKRASKLREEGVKTIVVGCRNGREYWYEDFADKFLIIENLPTSNAVGWRPSKKGMQGASKEKPDEFDEWIDPTVIRSGQGLRKDHEYHANPWEVGKGQTPKRVLLHCRNFGNKCSYPKKRVRDGKWSRQVFRTLSYLLNSEGIDYAFIGDSRYSYSPEGALSLQDVPLTELAKHMTNAHCVVGVSSGPMHLAQMHGKPIISWGQANLQGIYKHKCNPFEAPVHFFKGWNPPPMIKLINCIKDFHISY